MPARDDYRSPSQYEALPQFDPQGRQRAAESGDLSSVANSLAQQLSGASHYDRRGEAPQGTGAAWSFGDLLSRASANGDAQPSYVPRRQEPSLSARGANGSGQGLQLDELARAIDQRTAAEVWQRFRAGERGVLGRHIYSREGQGTFDEILRRYDRDTDFRGTVERYMTDFERLLGEAERSDPDGRTVQGYLTSDTGRVYLLLAHASGHIR
jgi:hypothetical protein